MDNKREQIELLERQSVSPGFWDDQEKATKVQQELGQLQDVVSVWDRNWQELDDADMLLDMALEEKDESSFQEVVSSLDELRKRVDTVELECMFSSRYTLGEASHDLAHQVQGQSPIRVFPGNQ